MPLGVEHVCRYFLRQAKFGLFHGIPMHHGIKVSKRGKNKTKRTWKPNIQRASLYSEALDKKIRLTVTTTALRQIDYHGGLDNYLINVKPIFRQSDVAKRLRAEILAKRKEKPELVPKKSVAERFYVEKVLKPNGRVKWEMVSELTGQRLDKKTKREIIPNPKRDAERAEIKVIPPLQPVDMEELRRKFLGE